MVDTVRTLAALQALLADNTAGNISAQDIRDMLVSVFPTVVRKTVTESVTSSITLQDDDELFFNGLAGVSYAVVALLIVDGATAGDIFVGLDGPGDHVGLGLGVIGSGTNATTFENASLNNQAQPDAVGWGSGLFAGTLGAGNENMVIMFGTVTLVSAGAIRVIWAQKVSSTTPTRVFAGSVLIGLPVNQ